MSILVLPVLSLMLCLSARCVLSQRPVCQCVPPKFVVAQKALTVQIGNQSKTATIVREDALIAFDSTSETSASLNNVTLIDGSWTGHYQVITDHTKKTRWTIDLDSNTCDRTRYTTKLVRCVPNEANYTDSFYVGSKELFADDWMFVTLDPYEIGVNTLALLGDSCIPLRATFVGEIDNVQTTSSMSFEDYEDGIADPDRFFRIPDYCPLKATDAKKKKPGVLRYHLATEHFFK